MSLEHPRKHVVALSNEDETVALQACVEYYRMAGRRVNWAMVGSELKTTPGLAKRRWAYLRDRRRRLRLRERSYYAAKKAFLEIAKKKAKMDVAPFRGDAVPLAPELLWSPVTSCELDKLHDNPFVAVVSDILFDALLCSVLNMLD
mgnify:FL=1